MRQILEPEDADTPSYCYALGAAYARLGEREQALGYMRAAREKAAVLGQRSLLESIDRDLRTLGAGSKSP